MNFSESGLPKHPLVEKAFTHSLNNLMAAEPQAFKELVRDLEQRHRQGLHILNQQKDAGRISEEDFKREKEELEKNREETLRVGPGMIRQELVNVFKAQRLQPTNNAAKWTDNPSPEMLSAVLLLETVRSPFDFRVIEKEFGDSVSETLAALLHINAYPQQRVETLTAASTDVKAAYLTLTITNIERTSARIDAGRRQGQLSPVMLTYGQEEQIYNDVLAVWGSDKKLDAQLVQSFNKLCGLTVSTFRLEVNANGGLDLVKGNPPATPPKLLTGPKPPTPKGGGGWGDDVF